MKIAAIIVIPQNVKKEDLRFKDFFLPDELARRLKTVSDIQEIFFAADADYDEKIPEGCEKINYGKDGELLFLKSFFSQHDFEHVLLVQYDSPFLDPNIISEMLKLHVTYLPEYTYSENVPSGFCGECISRALMESIPEQTSPAVPLSQIIKSNLHRFDVEIFYSHPDVRDRRISFRSSNLRERRIMEHIVDRHGGIPKYAEIADVLKKFPETLYLAPSYLEVELNGQCNLNCIFCYRKTLATEHGQMEVPIFRKILEGMRDFGLPYHICFGGSGEPLMHSGFYEMMDLALAEGGLSSVVVETNGVYADANFAQYISGKSGKVRVIVNLNAVDEETYRALHGGDHYNTVVANIERLREVVGESDSLYVQIMKINETEKFLDRYYDIWEQKRVPIILQKQNTYLGRIPDRRYSDLSPLERIPCWHLQRDLYVLYDGTVCFCKQDVDGASSKGNVKDSTIKELFEKGRNFFVEDFKGNRSKKPDCSACDEWYTFNL